MQKVVFFILCFCSVVYAQYSAGEALGHKLFLEGPQYTADTVDWQATIDSFQIKTSSKVPNSNELATQNLVMYRLKNPTAVTTVILKDLGYTIVLLSQIVITPNGNITVANNPKDVGPETRRYYSDYFWQRLNGFELVKPSVKVSDYVIHLEFGDGGSCEYLGNANILEGKIPIKSSEGTKRIDFSNTSIHENLYRVNRRAYLIANVKISPEKIGDQLEKRMDELKLGMEYSVPKFEKLGS